MANAVRRQKLREAIADAIAENVKAYDVADVCVDLLRLEPPGEGEDPFYSKRVYVKGRLLNKSIAEMEAVARLQTVACNLAQLAAMLAGSSPTAASSASRSASVTVWCTREGDSPIAVARVRIEIPSARAETSAHVRSRSAWSSRHAARETRVRTRRSRRAASIRSLIVTRPACQPRSGNWTP